jgi:hypothetical protein
MMINKIKEEDALILLQPEIKKINNIIMIRDFIENIDSTSRCVENITLLIEKKLAILGKKITKIKGNEDWKSKMKEDK